MEYQRYLELVDLHGFPHKFLSDHPGFQRARIFDEAQMGQRSMFHHVAVCAADVSMSLAAGVSWENTLGDHAAVAVQLFGRARRAPRMSRPTWTTRIWSQTPSLAEETFPIALELVRVSVSLGLSGREVRGHILDDDLSYASWSRHFAGPAEASQHMDSAATRRATLEPFWT
ncbi:unnamed protein product [Prorocentrum cordatum]|uniref:Uncharacterized protein n=1 Tax=Prorocentrum cordatum TaxID=2364126 RepID=A0ABN9RNH0_9DINO|nr:unnamed protein product [Polarella glacialis]